MTGWWKLSKFDVAWITIWLTASMWLTGTPHGLTEWIVYFAAVCAGWFSLLYAWWKTR